MRNRALQPFAFVLALAVSMAATQLASGQQDAFPELFDTQDTASQPLTSPEEALASFTLPAGFSASLFAAEPMVQNPIAMAWDAKGRLWIAENYTYAEADTNFESAVRDRIIILNDTDHDGRADERTVFWDGAQKLTSIEIDGDGIWALCAPQLLFLPDRNHDDRLDDEPIVVLDGWNDDEVRHNIVNGLRWGPDGWLYGRHGILATSSVGAPGTSPDQRVPINCGIWRYHPQRAIFEVVARGTTNPWGTDWDQYGEMFFINTVIGHLWHVVYGSHYERMYGEDFDPYLYDLMPQVADHVHWNTGEIWSDVREGVSEATDAAGGGHAHSGLMVYLGDSWPNDYYGDVFTINLHGRRLNRDQLKLLGSSYTATHAPDLLSIGDVWFRGIDLGYGPDGSVWVLDWSDIGECHENDGVHRHSGRIYKVSYGTAAPYELDLGTLSSSELLQLQKHANEWLVRQARQQLMFRARAGEDMSDSHEQLRRLFADSADEITKLRAMWCLYVTGGANSQWLNEQLHHKSFRVRTWAVRLLSDGPLTAIQTAEFARLAEEETSGLVLLTLASSLQRIEASAVWPLAEKLVAHDELSEDRYFPLLVWYGVAPVIGADPARGVDLLAATKIPRLRRLIARRITQQMEVMPEAFAELIALLVKVDSDEAAEMMEGISIALQGHRQAPKPQGWDSVAETLRQSPNESLQQRVRELALVFGDGRAVEELLAIARSAKADIAVRRDALRALVAARAMAVEPLLRELLSNRDLAVDAVRGLAALGSEETAAILIERYPDFNEVVRDEVLQALVSRPAFAKLLLSAIQQGAIDRNDVSAFQLRQLRGLGDDEIAAATAQIWPENDAVHQEAAERIRHYAEIIRSPSRGTSDAARGKVLFQRACASCHVMFGEGGKIGPDLTGAQRTNLQYLLENIIDPSAQVGENFRMSVLVLADGRVINGIVGGETEQTLTVQTPTEKIVVLKDDIDDLRESQLSIMPEHLLEPLSEQEVRDLFAYLMASQPIEN